MTFLSKTWLPLALLALALSAQAQRPTIGSTMNFGAKPNGREQLMLDARLYPQPSQGREPLAEVQATERAIRAIQMEACGFTKAEADTLPKGQPIYVMTVAELQEVPRKAVGLKGQDLSENQLWARMVHPFRASCTGWYPLGAAKSAYNRDAPPVAAAPSVAPAPVAAAPGQPPGFFCPAGWMPNPSGKVRANGSFSCFADKTSVIPTGYQCPAGMKLQDSSATGMLVCQAR